MTVRKYGRFWSLYDGDTLVAVIVYKKGAEEVRRRLLGIEGGLDAVPCS